MPFLLCLCHFELALVLIYIHPFVVTLCAVSAAFAAMTTALLCIVFLDGKSSDNLLLGRSRELTRFGPHQLDAPRNHRARFKSTADDVAPVLQPLKQDRYRRRTISLNSKKKVLTNSATEGVAWLMVRAAVS